MQAMGHVMAEVDARQRTLREILRIHDLHLQSNTQARGQPVPFAWERLEK